MRLKEGKYRVATIPQVSVNHVGPEFYKNKNLEDKGKG